LYPHLIQQQSSKGIVSNTPGHGNILSQATQGNRCVQGVAAGKDGDSIAQHQLTGFRKPGQWTGEHVYHHITYTENLFRIL
jgi:hypothetical protein